VQQKFPTPAGVKWFDTRVVAECNEAGEIESFLAITRDVTERAQAEEARKRSEQRFRALVENTPDLIFEIDADGTFTYLSPSSHTVKGFPPEALQGTHIRDRVHPDDDAHAEETLRRLLMEQQPDGAQVRVLHGDGNWRMHWPRLTPLFDASGTLTGAIGIARDVTQEKQTEEALRQSEEQARRLLEEKELLLREVHHRIKNDMAMIEGLLMLQAQSVESAEAATALEEARRRIAVMKNAYRQLYEGGDIQRVDLQTFAGTLISEIERSHGTHRAIEVSRDIEAVMIPSRSAFPLGIIVNELLTNAYKYAFPGERSGSIHVRIEREEASRESRQESEPKQGARLRLTVTDDGIGIPEDAATAESSSGIQLVQSLAEQHHGTFTLHHDGGTVAEVELKLPEA
jgi:PAS domain S-box-containing protein